MTIFAAAKIRFMIIGLLITLIPVYTSAAVYEGKDQYYLTKTDTIFDDLYIGAEKADIRGVITHDLMIAAREYMLTGRVMGSVNSATQDAAIRGRVDGSARIFAQMIDVEGKIGNNIIACGQSIDLSQTCRVTKDALICGDDISISGEIGGNMHIYCGSAIIDGKIGGDLHIEAEQISLISPAEVSGDITYKSKNEIEIGEGVTVLGNIEWETEEEGAVETDDNGLDPALRIILFFCSLLTGLILIPLFNHHTRIASEQIIDKPLVSLGVGFVGFCIAPFAVVILIATVIGIPAALMLSFLVAIFFYVSKIYVAIAFGRLGIRAFRKNANPKQGWCLLFGLIILTILISIPVLGWIVYFGAVFCGMGAIILGIRDCRNNAVATNATSPPAAPLATAGRE